MSNKKEKAIFLLDEVLKNLENPKITLLNNIQKLNRIGRLLDEEKLIKWTEVQLGNLQYTEPLTKFVESYVKHQNINTEKSKKALEDITKTVQDIGLIEVMTNEELTAKAIISGGGFTNIGFIEQKYHDLAKIGNDGTYYKSNISNTISVIKSLTYKKAAFYHKKYSFEGLPESNFEILKTNVDDILLDLNPELAEQLMLAFKGVSSKNKEEWSQGLTSCRRFFEKFADSLYPATEDKLNGRSLNQENYINRIWAFMDQSIKSDSNKELAKKHIDFIGSYLQSLYKFTNKGVHSDLTRIEALKVVMHIYLICVDLLNLMKTDYSSNNKISVYSASIDELEAIGNVSRKVAKEIIKLRVINDVITKDHLLKIPGLGEKTLNKLMEKIILEK